jgi:hypothetical protein
MVTEGATGHGTTGTRAIEWAIERAGETSPEQAGYARAELAALVEAAGRAAVAEAVLLAVVNRGHRAWCPRTTAARGRVACRCGVDTVGDALAALRAGGADS